MCIEVAPSTHGVDLLNAPTPANRPLVGANRVLVGANRFWWVRTLVRTMTRHRRPQPRHAWMAPTGAQESSRCCTDPYRQQLATALQCVPLTFAGRQP